MVEEILPLDELKKIAKEYVRQEEQLGDVEVEDDHGWSSQEGVLLCVIRGKVNKYATTKDFRVAVIAERPFILTISAKDGKIGKYWPRPWIPKSVEEAPSESYVVFEEPFGTHGASSILKRQGKKYGFDPSRFRP